MTTHIYYHPDNLAHDPGPEHSERADRLRAIVSALKSAALPNAEWKEPPLGVKEDIARVHKQKYVDFVFNSIPETGYQAIEINEVISDHDDGEVTVLCPASGNAVLRAIGGATMAVDSVITGVCQNAFCLTRPPGHHARSEKAMGFCVFGTAAIAARYAQKKFNLRRIAIVDFDVHHGNGTQEIFETDPSIFFASIHQLPLWPESGHEEEIGIGNVLNVPVSPNTPRETWLEIWREKILTRLNQESFDLLIICAGFDAHKDDPKGDQNLETGDYRTIVEDLMRIANTHCQERVIVLLEGGYALEASAASAVSVAQALTKQR